MKKVEEKEQKGLQNSVPGCKTDVAEDLGGRGAISGIPWDSEEIAEMPCHFSAVLGTLEWEIRIKYLWLGGSCFRVKELQN